MPELPEVETVRRSLNESTCDRPIISKETISTFKGILAGLGLSGNVFLTVIVA